VSSMDHGDTMRGLSYRTCESDQTYDSSLLVTSFPLNKRCIRGYQQPSRKPSPNWEVLFTFLNACRKILCSQTLHSCVQCRCPAMVLLELVQSCECGLDFRIVNLTEPWK
jgi:hypothetical protein